MGVKTLGVVATDAERARLYFRFRRPRMPMGADPELATHRAYGLPNMPVPPEMWDAVERAAVRELKLPESPPGGAYQQLARFDAYQVTTADNADFERHQAQLAGQFLVDARGASRISASSLMTFRFSGSPSPAPAVTITSASSSLTAS